MNYVAHGIGIFAFLFFIFSVQYKDKGKLLVFQLISNTLYGIQYILLNVITAGIMNFISIFRCLVFYKYDKDKKQVNGFWLAFILIAILLVALFTVKSPIHIIPILISILYTVSTWQSNMKIVRIVFTVCAFGWLYYNFTVGAYTALIGNIFEISSGFISLIRHKDK